MKKKKIITFILILFCAFITLPVNALAKEEEITAYDFAKLAVEYAWPTRAESVGNNGTELYQQMHDQAFPNDYVYASCDRSITTAIVSSGADPDLPPGNCQMIDTYCTNSEKWQYLGTNLTYDYEDLQPGDIFVMPGYHVIMYVGEELIQQIHQDKATTGTDTVEGSISRVWSPGCDDTVKKIYEEGNYAGYVPKIYRFVESENVKEIEQTKEYEEEIEENNIEVLTLENNVENEIVEDNITKSKDSQKETKIEKPKKDKEQSKEQSKEDVLKEIKEEAQTTGNKALEKVNAEVHNEVVEETEVLKEDNKTTVRNSAKWLLLLLGLPI